MGELLAVIVIGAIVGLIARAVLPGRQAIGAVWTVVIGIVGALIGNFVGERISPDGTMHWILAVVVSVGLLMLWGSMSGRKAIR